MNWFYVFLGGGLGSVMRFGIGMFFSKTTHIFPLGTLIANLIAALIIGFLYYIGLKEKSNHFWLLLSTGFCGGLSTFSAFSLETFELMKNGELFMAVLNVGLSFLVCLLAIWVASIMI